MFIRQLLVLGLIKEESRQHRFANQVTARQNLSSACLNYAVEMGCRKISFAKLALT
jgi:hypothetical protein